MRIEDLFDFDLPPDRIALRPASPRDAARLLVVRPGAAAELEDRMVRDLPDLLRPGDQLVVNDTKVIPAQLRGRRIGRETEPKIEATLIKRLDGSRWQALVKPARKLAPGDVGAVRRGGPGVFSRSARRDRRSERRGRRGDVRLSPFTARRSTQAIAERGEMPLPPYIAARRAADEQDRVDYQTMFAREEGAVAAPTAGLHFTDALMARSPRAGSRVHSVTLHVGAGTFLPVKAEDIAEHKMHAEWGEVTPRPPQRSTPRARGRPHRRGRHHQRCGCSKAPPTRRRDRSAFAGETAIFITPGYRFRAVDVLLTNFHLPRSTLFMLVVGLLPASTRMKRAYAHAIAAGYRFYSYGDACLLFPDAQRMIALRRSSRTDGAARRGVLETAARRSRDAGLHAGRHRGARSRRCGPRGRRRPAPRSSSATPIT